MSSHSFHPHSHERDAYDYMRIDGKEVRYMMDGITGKIYETIVDGYEMKQKLRYKYIKFVYL